MKYTHDEPKDQTIKKGDKILYGVFYGTVKGFNKDNSKIVVDFSNGYDEPDMIQIISIKKVKKVENVRIDQNNDLNIKYIESIGSKYPKMDVREQIALCVYYNVYDMLEKLAHRSNSMETTFVRDIQIFCKEKIEYYERGGT